MLKGVAREHISNRSRRILFLLVNKRHIKNSNDENNQQNTTIQEEFNLPPEPTNCCMSGCANCVWIEYAKELTNKFCDGGERARSIIIDKITDPNLKMFLQLELRNFEKECIERDEKL